MPGSSHPWPEGAFYRFDEIYDRARLDYRGPKFGWWFVPDQFTLARLDALEIAPPLAPAGVRGDAHDQHARAVRSDRAIPAGLGTAADRSSRMPTLTSPTRARA